MTAACLTAIADSKETRDTLALVYARAIRYCYEANESGGFATDRVDWSAVNGAILKRYKASGLNYIKKEAWKLAHAPRLV